MLSGRDFNEQIKAYSSPAMPSEEESLVTTAVIPTEQMKSIFAIKLQKFHDKLLSVGYRSRSQRSYVNIGELDKLILYNVVGLWTWYYSMYKLG